MHSSFWAEYNDNVQTTKRTYRKFDKKLMYVYIWNPMVL